MHPYTFDTNTTPPWFTSVVGGKRPKAKAKPTQAKKEGIDAAETNADEVNEIMQHRLQMPHNSQKCMARTFRLLRT